MFIITLFFFYFFIFFYTQLAFVIHLLRSFYITTILLLFLFFFFRKTLISFKSCLSAIFLCYFDNIQLINFSNFFILVSIKTAPIILKIVLVNAFSRSIIVSYYFRIFFFFTTYNDEKFKLEKDKKE